MNRKVAIASCTAVLCLAALAVWLFVKRGDQDGPVPKGQGDNGQAKGKPPEIPVNHSLIFEMPVQVAFFGNGELRPCYVDRGNKIVHLWKGVVLSREQLRQTPYGGTISGMRVLDPKGFTVESVEAPVMYRKVDGGYRPGYLDRAILAFYEWAGVTLSKDELLDQGLDGKDPIVKPAFQSQAPPQVIEIEMPAHLKDKPEFWKKKI